METISSMKHNRPLLPLLLFLLVSLTADSQIHLNSVDIVAYWKINETHSVKIKTTTTDVEKGIKQSFNTTFDATFKILNASDSGYTLEWIYTNSNLAKDEPAIESQVINHLINSKIIMKLSETGRFVELVNVTNIKAATELALDNLIKDAKDEASISQFKAMKQFIDSRQGLEILLLKHVKFYNLLFGLSYKTNEMETYQSRVPNPLGGEPYDVIEKIWVTKLDKASSTCTIETSKIIEGSILMASVIEQLQKVSKENLKELNDRLAKENLEISDRTMHQIDLSKGIIQKAVFRKVMNLGFQNREVIWEIETVN